MRYQLNVTPHNNHCSGALLLSFQEAVTEKCDTIVLIKNHILFYEPSLDFVFFISFFLNNEKSLILVYSVSGKQRAYVQYVCMCVFNMPPSALSEFQTTFCALCRDMSFFC